MADTIIELEGPTRARPKPGLRAGLVVASVVLLTASVVGLFLVGEDAASPAEQLARTQAFVEEAKTAHFTTEQHDVHSSGDKEVGNDFSSRSKVVGAVSLPDRSQWTADQGDFAYEGVIVPGGSYFREASTVTELAGEQWAYQEDRSKDSDTPIGAVVAMNVAGGFATAMDAPQLLDMLRAAQEPEQVSEHVVRAEVDVRKMPGFDRELYVHPETNKPLPLPDVTIELTSGPEDRLDRMVVTTKEQTDASMFGEDEEPGLPSSSTSTSDTRFTKWGEPVTIDAPAPETVDPTPGIDEEGLAAFKAFPLLAVDTPPAGFQLTMAEVYMTEDDADEGDEGDCAEVDLSYENVAAIEAAEAKAMSSHDAEDFEYPAGIEIELTPADCDYFGALSENEGDPIKLGRLSGRIVRSESTDEDYATIIEVVIGATRVNLMSDLPEAQVIAAASTLVPLDLASQPVHRAVPPPVG